MEKIIGIVALYRPTMADMYRIEKYVESLDYCILQDDSGEDNSTICSYLLNKYQGKIEYRLNEGNIGLCKSVNKGFSRAKDLDADWILVMNPDGTFENSVIDIYRRYIREHDVSKTAIICPQYNYDRHKRSAKMGHNEIDYADMSGSLYQTNVLEKIGFYDEKTYFYGLDTEFCLRVKRRGLRIIQCMEAVLNHNPASTQKLELFGKTIFQYGKDSPQRYYYQIRTGYYLHIKYHDIKQDFFILYKIWKVIFLFDNKEKYLNYIYKAIRDVKRGYFGKLEE